LYILNKKIKNAVLDIFQGTSISETFLFSEEMPNSNLQDDVISQDSNDEEEDKPIEIKNSKLVFDRFAGVLHVTDDRHGHIIKWNKNLQSIFGYSGNELSEKKMRMIQLMPPIYAKNHDYFMQLYGNTGRSKALYK
jgi:hypothetical protein